MFGYVDYDIGLVRGPLANAFVILINALFINVKLIGLQDQYPRDYGPQLMKEEADTFDFIIVGGGAAGCALANRLTEQLKWSVLLIEAGDYPSASTEVPGLYSTLTGSREDWQFRTEEEPMACQGMQGKVCTISRGRALGGTSSINDMLYIRGLPDDYDKAGFDRWCSNNTYRFFEEIERFVGNGESFYYQYGRTGVVHLEQCNVTNRVKTALEQAYIHSGSKMIPKRHSIGMINHPVLIRDGERINMAKAFLTPIKDRPNLLFTRNTEVLGITLTDPVDKRANGVNVSIDGIKFFLRAKKEVILAAGGINNAKLLLLSGLGPKEYLRERNIEPRMHIPAVGKNLQLHLTVPMFVALTPNATDIPREFYFEGDVIRDTFEYIMYRTGVFSHVGIDQFVNYVLTKKVGTTVPNLAVHHMYFKIGDRNLLAWLESSNYVQAIKNALIKYNNQREIVLFLVTLTSPISRGEVVLNETHFLSNPTIRGNVLSDRDNVDFKTILSGFDFITNMTSLLEDYNTELLDLDIPNCRNYKFCTLKYVHCYIQNMAYPTSDVAGTTKMGDECDDTAVVDQDLEVKRIRCLRVADSSVLNYITVDGTVATDAMIAYHLGEILKEKWVKDYVSEIRPEKKCS